MYIPYSRKPWWFLRKGEDHKRRKYNQKVQSTNILAWPIARTSCPAHLWYFNYQCREYIRHHPVYRIRTSAWINFTWTSKNDFECRNGAEKRKMKTCINFQQILYDIYIKEVSIPILQNKNWSNLFDKLWHWFLTRRHANQAIIPLSIWIEFQIIISFNG